MFKDFALMIFTVFVINSLASYFHWYESFHNFDKFVHFLGGVTVSFLSSWFFYKKYTAHTVRGQKKALILFNSFIFVLIALLWEGMEFGVQNFFSLGHLLATPIDSLGDVLVGLLGSFVGLYHFFQKLKHAN
jgi:hypothetical protein